MTKTAGTYTQGTGPYYMDVLINPDTLKSGALVARLNVRAFPKVGVTSSITTSTALTVSPSGSQQESTALVLTATITPSEVNGPVDGTVTFKNGGSTIGISQAFRGVATLTIANLPVGTDSLTAVYAGNGEYGGSTAGAVSEVITLDATTTALAITPAGSQANTVTLTMTATVTPATATGTVTFKDGATTVGTGSLASGVATATTTLTAGSHTMTAVYGGDSLNAASTSAGVVRTST